MSVNTVKEVRIKNTNGTYDSQPVGAEGQYVEISRDANGDIIEDITAAGVVVDSTEGLTETLKNLEESAAGSNEFSEMTDVDFTSLADKNLVQYDSTAAKWKNIAMDSTPTASSNKPVTSGGIKTALDLKTNDADLKKVAKSGKASDVNYTNTTSGLTATNAQAAIDEVNQTLTNNLSDEINNNANNGVKNQLIPNQNLVVDNNASETISAPVGTLVLDKIQSLVLSFEQANAISSISRNTLLLHLASGSELYPTNVVSPTINAGYHEGVINNVPAGTYEVRIWSQTPDVDVEYTNFMIRDISITDNTYQPYAKTNQQLTAKNEALTKEVAATLNTLGAKNFLETLIGSGTTQGVTYTINADGSITLNGTCTAWTNIKLDYIAGQKNIPSGSYILNGSISGNNKFRLSTYVDGTKMAESENGNEASFTIPSTATEVYTRFEIDSTATFNNETFYPMIRLSSIEDDTYAPYAKTNQELTAENQALTNNVKARAELGAYNLLNINDYTNIYNLSIANNGITNTATDTRAANIWIGMMKGGTALSSALLNETLQSTGIQEYTFTIPDDADFNTLSIGHNGASKDLKVRVPFNHKGTFKIIFDATGIDVSTVGGYSLTNIMICLASDSDPTYQPYAMTNRELTEKINEEFLQNMASISAQINYKDVYLFTTNGGSSSGSAQYSSAYLVFGQATTQITYFALKEGTEITPSVDGTTFTLTASTSITMAYRKL